ncbi:MAG: hypothetical protein V3R99_13105 [Thermoguttaceae bacterium]
MQDIDFLPDQYRRKNRRRQSQPSRIGIIVAFAALLIGAVSLQYYQRRQAQRQLAELLPQYDLAMSQNEQLAEISGRLRATVASAQLFTYLRHPWPRTQLLDALLAPLPEEITFERLQIVGGVPPSLAAARRQSTADNRAKEAEIAALPSAARDLRQLRDQFDAMETIVHLSGTTTRSSALHGYLSELGNAPLFSAVELESIESLEAEPNTLQFDAAVVVRPGYGQPGGPATSTTDTAMQDGLMSSREEIQ